MPSYHEDTCNVSHAGNTPCRNEQANDDSCPECGEDIDITGICTECGYCSHCDRPG